MRDENSVKATPDMLHRPILVSPNNWHLMLCLIQMKTDRVTENRVKYPRQSHFDRKLSSRRTQTHTKPTDCITRPSKGRIMK